MTSTAPANPLGRFRLPGLLLGVVLGYGIAGYVVIEHWNLLDAFYMTLITITTVGYGEVHPLSGAGKLFTSSLIAGGVGTMLYAFGIFTEMLSEGQLAIYGRRRAMDRRVGDLRDHFIICGYGRIGAQIAEEFGRSSTAYIVVDNNPEAVARLIRDDRLHLDGDASGEDVLRRAGIDRARGLISAVDSDERSVYVTLAARALNPALFIVARAGQPASIRRLELAGANRVISPYRMAGHHMAELSLRPALLDVMDYLHHGDSEIGVDELTVRSGCAAVGRSIAEAGLTGEEGARLLALRRRDGTLHVDPGPELFLQEGDLIVAIGSVEQLSSTAALLQ